MANKTGSPTQQRAVAAKKRNAQDATLRNVRAANRRLVKMTEEIAAIEMHVESQRSLNRILRGELASIRKAQAALAGRLEALSLQFAKLTHPEAFPMTGLGSASAGSPGLDAVDGDHGGKAGV